MINIEKTSIALLETSTEVKPQGFVDVNQN